MADRARNQANYLAHKRLATIDFLAHATVAKEKLDVALTNHYPGKRGWGDFQAERQVRHRGQEEAQGGKAGRGHRQGGKHRRAFARGLG